MMPLVRDEEARLHGWDVFRSSSRDRMVPCTSGGRVLQRVKINEAVPVPGVFEGVAISEADREAMARARAAAMGEAMKTGTDRPLGVSRYISFHAQTINAAEPVGVNNDHICVIARAPFDGFITEMAMIQDPGLSNVLYAVRSSSGQTMFQSVGVPQPGGIDFNLLPDFVDYNGFFDNNALYTLRNVKMPVYAGEEIFFVIRENGSIGPNVAGPSGVLGFEGFILARPGSAAAESQFRALNTAAINAARDAATNASRLEIERERTRRELGIAQSKVQIAAEQTEQARVNSARQANTRPQIIQIPAFQQKAETRAPVTPPQPAFSGATNTQLDGKGKTFVSSWMPSNNGIGYLIPDPPRGGKVNVFGDTYTIWDASGKNVGQGKIEMVQTDAQIPDQARISPNRGGSFPGGQSMSPAQLNQLLNAGSFG